MLSLPHALRPRDRASAARTLVFAATFSLVATAGWELSALVTGRDASTPASAAQAVGSALVVLLLARACWLAPDRVPWAVYPGVAVVSPFLVAGVSLTSQDASAAGQFGLVYPVVYAATHFRRAFAWWVAALAVAAGAVIVLDVLPLLLAVADILVVGPAIAMLTVVLVDLAERQDRLVHRLNELAAADPLTGLATRRELEAVVERTLRPAAAGAHRRHADEPGTLGLLLLDVDRFKSLNDTYGHPTGDAVLVHVAGLVRGAVRDTDTVARLGGDEMAVLLLAPAHEIEARARAVHEAVRGTTLPTLDAVEVTVSVGVAYRDVGRTSFAELYAAADRALYEAKERGRDAVVVASTPG